MTCMIDTIPLATGNKLNCFIQCKGNVSNCLALCAVVFFGFFLHVNKSSSQKKISCLDILDNC